MCRDKKSSFHSKEPTVKKLSLSKRELLFHPVQEFSFLLSIFSFACLFFYLSAPFSAAPWLFPSAEPAALSVPAAPLSLTEGAAPLVPAPGFAPAGAP